LRSVFSAGAKKEIARSTRQSESELLVYQRYAPSRLGDFMGVKNTLEALEIWISRGCTFGRFPLQREMFLITGPTGTGKSSLARMFLRSKGYTIVEVSLSTVPSRQDRETPTPPLGGNWVAEPRKSHAGTGTAGAVKADSGGSAPRSAGSAAKEHVLKTLTKQTPKDAFGQPVAIVLDDLDEVMEEFAGAERVYGIRCQCPVLATAGWFSGSIRRGLAVSNIRTAPNVGTLSALSTKQGLEVARRVLEGCGGQAKMEELVPLVEACGGDARQVTLRVAQMRQCTGAALTKDAPSNPFVQTRTILSGKLVADPETYVDLLLHQHAHKLAPDIRTLAAFTRTLGVADVVGNGGDGRANEGEAGVGLVARHAALLCVEHPRNFSVTASDWKHQRRRMTERQQEAAVYARRHGMTHADACLRLYARDHALESDVPRSHGVTS
jgi:hypothetical protein